MRLRSSICLLVALTTVLSFSLIVNCENLNNSNNKSQSQSNINDNHSNSNNNKLTDDYVQSTQMECYSSKRIASCFKYRIARYLWSFATGRMNIFSPENDLSNGIRLIQLNEPAENGDMFPESRQFSAADSDLMKAIKFGKRAISQFVASHGVRLGLGNESGARLIEEPNYTDAARNRKTKKKWNIIFPLAILLKLTHLKLTILPLVLGIGIIQLLLIGGGAILFFYLKNNTLCRIQPHLVHSHSHVASESSPDVSYTSYGNYAAYPGAAPYAPGATFSKDWAANRAYKAYSAYDADKHKQQ